jgi:hypothetical protein
MRKQTDFDVRVFPLGNGSGGESMTHEQVGEFVRTNYLDKGWEVLSANNNQVSAGVIYLQVVLVKWEDVADEVRSKRASS